MNKNEWVNVRVDEDTKKKLEKLAEQENRTLSNYIDTVLKRHVEESNVNNSYR